MGVRHLDLGNASHYRKRLARLAPDAARRWGTMGVTPMLAHVRRSIEISLGEVKVQDKSNFLTRTVVRRLAFEVLPIPKGRIKAPAYFFPDSVASFDAERRALEDAISRFLEALSANPARVEISEVFGPMPLSYWALIHGKHFDHHLKQFGV